MDNTKATTIFLSLGTNQGDRIQNLENAASKLAASCGKIISQSTIFETAAWGKTDQNDFLNQVIKMESGLSAEDLLQKVLAIELEMGRFREARWGPRIIDIDILFYGNEIIVSPSLIVPHPEFSKRNFVLIPLNEIAAGWIDPVSDKSISELLALNKDPLEVRPYSI